MRGSRVTVLLVIATVAVAFPQFHDDSVLTQFLEVETTVGQTPKEEAFRALNGRIRLNARTYQTACQCADSATTKFCNPPFRLHIHQEDANKELGLTIPDLRRILGRPTDFKLTPVQHMSFADVDGRQKGELLCTPGGDFGEFLMALTLYENLSNQKLTTQAVESTLRSWLAVLTGTFYFATDDAALQLLAKKIGSDALNIASLKLSLQKSALDRLIKPEFNGSPFIRAVLLQPEQFRTNLRLVQNLIKAVFNILWDTSSPGPLGLLSKSINLVVLEGTNSEKAWINVVNNHRCSDEGKASPFIPNKNGTTLFINHPEAVAIPRQALARFFLTRIPAISETMRTFVGLLNRQGLRSMETFAELAAGKLPIYSVIVE